MNSNVASGQTSRSASSSADTEHGGSDRMSENVNELRKDLASLKDNVARLATQAGGEAAKTIRGVSQTVASQVGTAAGSVADASSEFASTAREHARTFASELEGMARRNPLGTIAGALLAGVIIGMMARGRG